MIIFLKMKRNPLPNTYFHLFFVIIKVMFMFGLDIRNKEDIMIRRHSFYQKILSLFWVLYFVHTIITIITDDIYQTPTINSLIARKSNDVIAFLIWIVMKTRENKVHNLLQHMNYLRTISDVKLHSFWIWFSVGLTFAIPLLAWLSLILFLDETYCSSLASYYSLHLFSVPEGYSCLVSSVALLFSHTAIYALRTSVTVLYITICFFLRNLLNRHSEMGLKNIEKNTNPIDQKYCENYIDLYKHIIEISNIFEKVMSLPVFLITIADCMGIFYGFLKFEESKEPKKIYLVSYRFGILYIILRSLVSFLFVTFAASSVFESSVNAKTVLEKLTERLLISGQKKDNKELLLLFLAQNKSPLILSAWGFFNFTRSLVLSVLGVVLTYSLLMMQFVK
ncbi:uncharacterized protein NPIL_82071 [Nephila pilipes]|uniref:Gustatory receptor n=1 Tax=Nephila pilipes TaxID=299642 RepID=A0A8X6QVY7_NEPPI|nr:uncharacterized protein NPIL_82071 [Nephila pilipes]